MTNKIGLSLPLVIFMALPMAQPMTAHADESAVKVTANKLVINKDNIKVWTFQSPDNPAFNFRATTIFNTKLTSAVATILDTKALPSWVPYTKQVDLVDNIDSSGNFILHMVLDFPFPLSDRDVIVKGNINQQADGTVMINNKSIEDSRFPEKADYVRIKHYEGKWILKPINKEQIEVSTSGYADPAGSLPLSIVNMFVQKQPFMMLQKMREQLKKAVYQDVKVLKIKNFDE